jgi:hypothetical protein
VFGTSKSLGYVIAFGFEEAFVADAPRDPADCAAEPSLPEQPVSAKDAAKTVTTALGKRLALPSGVVFF